MANANRITLSPSQLETLLTAAITAPAPLRVLIVGAPGVAKTSITRQCFSAANVTPEIFKAGVHGPEDVMGLPFRSADGESADFLPFKFLKRVRDAAEGKSGRIGVFLDDMGQGTPAMNAALMKFVDDYKDNPNVIIVAASNRRSDRSGVNGLFEAVKSRFHTIVELQVNLRDWIGWAGKNGIDSRILSFLSFRPDLLHKFDPKTIGDMDNFPCPRTWEQASDILKLDLPLTVRSAALAGAIGPADAVELEGFIRTADSLPDVDALIVAPDRAPIPDEVSARWALAGALADRASKENLGRVLRYCERLHEAKAGPIAALALNLTLLRKPELISASNPHWTKAMAGPLGDLLIGSSAK